MNKQAAVAAAPTWKFAFERKMIINTVIIYLKNTLY